MARGIYGIVYRGQVIYVGQSVNISVRINQHRRALVLRNHRNFILQRIFDKYSGDALAFIVLEQMDTKALTPREQEWMDLLRPVANLSMANGSHTHTEEAKAKMRAYVRSEAHRQKLSDAHRGRSPATKGRRGQWRHSDEAKKRIADASRGREKSPDTLRRMSDSQSGRVFTVEHRAKLAAAKLGKPKPESARLALVGRKQSVETIAKRVAAFHLTMEGKRNRAANQ